MWLFTFASLPVAAELEPVDLRCEAMVDPLGIDQTRPGLSWKLAPTSERGDLAQRAYRIIVASSPKLLADGKADLWDSGKVPSKSTFGIGYSGKPLTSRQHCWWQVKVWDQHGAESKWSAPATFSLGLLSPTDWIAKWIGIDAPDRPNEEGARFSGAKWIWSSLDEQGKVPKVSRTFVKHFALTDVPRKALIHITADDQFVLFVNEREVAKSDGQPEAWRRIQTIEITDALRSGDNEISISATNDGESAAGVLAKLVLDGQEIVTDESWLVDGGSPATVVAPYGGGPWGMLGGLVLRGATYYRKEFDVGKRIARATAYVTALGLVDLHVNGSLVCDDLFTPGWSDYDKRLYYRTFDITDRLRSGQNAVGLILGDGWYSGYVGFGQKRGHYGDRPQVLAQIEIQYEDGSRQTVATDATWSAATGPITEQDFLMGETFDSRYFEKGWDEPGFRSAAWHAAEIRPDYKQQLQSYPAQPVRQFREVRAVRVIERPNGAYILDFGQNLAGFIRLSLAGSPGQEIVIRHGEWLDKDGSLYTTNLRGARAIDRFICSGEAQTWSPRFTFHGFQYVEVHGLSEAPKADTLVALAISSATPEVGKFECSDPLLNKLSSNAWWTQKMNFIDIPTDCPQRDERLGWTGDAQVYIWTACMYSDVQAFFRKWLVSLHDGQRPDGQFPMVAPLKVAWDDGGPAWADAGVICPWTIYEVYGDKDQLAQHYPAMRRFVEFCMARSTKDRLPPEKFHCFGDWLQIDAETPNEVIYTAYFAFSARLLAQAATVLGNQADADKYSRVAEEVKAAFNSAYVQSNGTVRGDTQCSYVLAIAFDLLDEPVREKAGRRLVDDIERRGWRLSTGFVGTRDLLNALRKSGHVDAAFKLLHQTEFPSWLFPVKNGATSIWERWDSWRPDRGFQDPGMNSFAHYAYGAVMGWIFTTIGGISPLEAGFGRISICPELDPYLQWAKTSYDSNRGPIEVSWERTTNAVLYEIKIPPNCTAEILLPHKRVEGPKGIERKGQKFLVGSGTYHFKGLLP
jgi:alpha-L-rhamnosidase